MKKIVFLFASVLLFTFSQSYGQKTDRASSIKIVKGLALDAQQDGTFDAFTFLVKRGWKTEQYISSVEITGVTNDILGQAQRVTFGSWTLYIFDIRSLNLTEDFNVRIEIGSGKGIINHLGYDIPGDGDGGPGGTPPPTVIIIKYP